MSKNLQRIIDKLREETAVFRVTLRLKKDEFRVSYESLDQNALSLKGPVPFDLRKAKTYQWLENEKRILVQDDVLQGPEPPKELHEIYGVGSQLLAGVFHNDLLTGIISVHHKAHPRKWEETEIKALGKATVLVEKELRR